jgi:hypothetical protein
VVRDLEFGSGPDLSGPLRGLGGTCKYYRILKGSVRAFDFVTGGNLNRLHLTQKKEKTKKEWTSFICS